jgi:hypothetical protein
MLKNNPFILKSIDNKRMSDDEAQPIKPVEPMEINTSPTSGEELIVKPKRTMGEKQLLNLSKAREKARVALSKKKRNG